MHKISTQLFHIVTRLKVFSTVAATLFMLLLVSSTSAQVTGPTPTTSSICEGAGITFTSSYTGGGNVESARWEYSATGNTGTWATINTSGGAVNGATTYATSGNTSTTTLTLSAVTVSYSGKYRAVYLRGNGTIVATSNPATLTVNAYPSATITQDTPLTFCSEGTVILKANTGTGLTYQWQKEGANISGATNSTYTADASGNYRVIVTNNTCSTTSSAVTVKEIQTPTAAITTTTPTTFCLGGSVLLTATATPATPLAPGSYSYAWFKDAAPISGATGTTYTATASGSYTVVITNTDSNVACASAPSAPVTVTVNPFPVATVTAPNGTSACPNNTVLLRAEPDGGSYAWYFGNDTNPIPGATGREYAAGATGNYRVQVTINNCSDFSDPIAVTILSPATVIAEAPQASFCVGSFVILHAATGTNYFYQWYKFDADNIAQAIEGATTSTLTVSQAGSYRVVVNINNSCSTTSDAIVVTETLAITNNSIEPPIITTICTGTAPGTITGSAPTGGNGTYTYLWESSTTSATGGLG